MSIHLSLSCKYNNIYLGSYSQRRAKTQNKINHNQKQIHITVDAKTCSCNFAIRFRDTVSELCCFLDDVKIVSRQPRPEQKHEYELPTIQKTDHQSGQWMEVEDKLKARLKLMPGSLLANAKVEQTLLQLTLAGSSTERTLIRP